MELEDLNQSNFWVSTRALREAADIKKSIKTSLHRKSLSVASNPSASASAPDKMDFKAVDQNLKTAHQRFNTASLENLNSLPPSNFSSTEKRCANKISRLNEEIFILSSELKQANEIISELSKKLANCNSKHAMNLQALQERHEQKMKRNHQEVEYLILSNKNSQKTEVDRIRNEVQIELKKQQELFNKKYNIQEKYFLEELEKKENDYKKQVIILKNHFIEVITELKTKFIEELECIQNKYNSKIRSIRNIQENKGYGGVDYEDESSTIIDIELEKFRNKDINQSYIKEETGESFTSHPIKPLKTNEIDFAVMSLLQKLKYCLYSLSLQND